jgi:hypothetical protein
VGENVWKKFETEFSNGAGSKCVGRRLRTAFLAQTTGGAGDNDNRR